MALKNHLERQFLELHSSKALQNTLVNDKLLCITDLCSVGSRKNIWWPGPSSFLQRQSEITTNLELPLDFCMS